MSEEAKELKRTPIYDLHIELGGKMVPFAGYEMPVQYPLGVKKEHEHTRDACGLFDVSHMGQAWLEGDDVAALFEELIPSDVQALKPGQQRYGLLMNDEGGIRDDLMVTRPLEGGDTKLLLVVNAACKDADFAYISEKLAGRATLTRIEDRALIAIQGPKTSAVAARLFGDELATMPFMSQLIINHDGMELWVSRAGYTGEDGYEISVSNDDVERLTRLLLAQDEVEAIGLGARDSLRLEAGLCLYGNDIDPTTSPVEADLLWSIGKRRRNEGGFPGYEVVRKHMTEGVSRRRVGISPEGRAPAREGTVITNEAGEEIGKVTSGGFGPTAGGPVAMGYVDAGYSSVDEKVNLVVRGKSLPATIVKMPFVPNRFYRG